MINYDLLFNKLKYRQIYCRLRPNWSSRGQVGQKDELGSQGRAAWRRRPRPGLARSEPESSIRRHGIARSSESDRMDSRSRWHGPDSNKAAPRAKPQHRGYIGSEKSGLLRVSAYILPAASRDAARRRPRGLGKPKLLLKLKNEVRVRVGPYY